MRYLVAFITLAVFACSRHAEERGQWLPNETLTILSERTGDTVLTHSDIPEAIIYIPGRGQEQTIEFRLTSDASKRYFDVPVEEPLAIRIAGETVVRFQKLSEIGSGPPRFSLPDTVGANGKHLSASLFTYHRGERGERGQL